MKNEEWQLHLYVLPHRKRGTGARKLFTHKGNLFNLGDFTPCPSLGAYTFVLTSHGPLNTHVRASLSRRVHSLSRFHRRSHLTRSDLQLFNADPAMGVRFAQPYDHIKGPNPSELRPPGSLPFTALLSFSHYVRLKTGPAARSQTEPHVPRVFLSADPPESI